MSVRIEPMTLSAYSKGGRQASELLFEKLHTYNAAFDSRFALSNDWRFYSPTRPNRTRSVWLAWDDNVPAGLVVVELRTDLPLFRNRRFVEVASLYVEPDYQGKGIGSQLLSAVVHWALQKGLADIRLYVTADNVKATDFYRKHGFKPLQLVMCLAL